MNKLSDPEIYIQFTKKDFIIYALILLIAYIFFYFGLNWVGFNSLILNLGLAINFTAFYAWLSIMQGVETGVSRVESD